MIVKNIVFRSGLIGSAITAQSLAGLFGLVPVDGYAQPVAGARAHGLSGAYSALANTADAVFISPAGIALISRTELALFYQKPYGLPELALSSIALTFPIHAHRVSLGILTLGNDIFRQSRFAAAYSHRYQERLLVGLSFSLYLTQIKGYGSNATAGLDLGVLLQLATSLNLAITVRNINRPDLVDAEPLPQIFQTGLAYAPEPGLTLTCDIVKDMRYSPELRFGVEYQVIKRLFARAGAATNPDRYSLGIGIDSEAFALDYAFFSHHDLGLTHQVSLSLRFTSGEHR